MQNEFVKCIQLVIAASLVNNIVFTRFLGLDVVFRLPKKTGTVAVFGITLTLFMMANAALNWLVFTYVLLPFHFVYLKIVVFMSIVMLLLWVSETLLKRIAPAFLQKLGITLTLIVTNGVILAVPLLTTEKQYSLPETVAFGLGTGLGFVIATVLMASLREKLDFADVPRPFKGLPIAFIVAGMIAVAFMGFTGLELTYK